MTVTRTLLIEMTSGALLLQHQLEPVSQIKHRALAFRAAIWMQLPNIIVIKVEQ